MTDKRFKWIVVASSIVAVLIAAMIILPGKIKVPRNSSKEKTELGEYIYIDRMDKVHTNRKSPKLNYKGMKSTRYTVEKFYPNADITFCPYCVSDKQYEMLTNHD